MTAPNIEATKSMRTPLARVRNLGDPAIGYANVSMPTVGKESVGEKRGRHAISRTRRAATTW